MSEKLVEMKYPSLTLRFDMPGYFRVVRQPGNMCCGWIEWEPDTVAWIFRPCRDTEWYYEELADIQDALGKLQQAKLDG